MSNLTLSVELSDEDRAQLKGLRIQVANLIEAVRPLVAAMNSLTIRAAVEATKTAEAEAYNQPTEPLTAAPTAESTPEKKPDLPVEDPVHLEPPKQEEPPFEVDKPADPEPEQKPVELSEFQKAITTKLAAHPELKPKLKELVNQYAKNVSGVPAEKRAEVLAAWAQM